MQIYLQSIGCRLNEAELESWAQGFVDAGHTICAATTAADVVIINTCAVTAEAVRKSRRLIRRAQRINPLAKLVISGCYASLEPECVGLLDGVDLIVENASKHALVDRVLDEIVPHQMPALATTAEPSALFARGRHRAFIKIQQGCRYRCTFCIVTIARGKERSRSQAEIISEINRLHAGGIYEVVLTGVHAGGYGQDINSSLAQLLQAILQETDIPRIRLGSLEPWDLPADFFYLWRNPRLMPHLHLPLQSGADRILKRMARRCKTADFATLVDNARSQIKDLNLTTDIIVGFPGEDVSAWQQSLAFIRQIGFAYIHIFPYSMRAGTKAATFSDQVPLAIKQSRSKELHALSCQMRTDFLQAQIGKLWPVLWEGEQCDTQTIYHGYTPNYLRIESPMMPAQQALGNHIIPTTVTAVCSDPKPHLLGAPQLAAPIRQLVS